MNQPEDKIWNVITNSAKTKFDYEDFRATFDGVPEENVSENILFMVIAGLAEGKSKDEIAGNINRELLPLALAFSESTLEDFLANKGVEFEEEIRATKVAAALLAQGRQVPGVLIQVVSMLKTIDDDPDLMPPQ